MTTGPYRVNTGVMPITQNGNGALANSDPSTFGTSGICWLAEPKNHWGTSKAAILKQQTPVLNERQVEVLEMVCAGKRNKEIAYQLGLSERTVKWYISQLFLIFGVSNRTELTALKSKALGS